MLKSFIKLVWKSILFPKLSEAAKKTPNTIDDAALMFVDSQIEKIIELLPI